MVEQLVDQSVSVSGKKAQIRPHEQGQQVQRRIAWQIVDVPVRQALKEIVEGARLVLQERANCCYASASEV